MRRRTAGGQRGGSGRRAVGRGGRAFRKRAEGTRVRLRLRPRARQFGWTGEAG
jgi:hypothetical protein